jgi:hypothetical protein
MNRPKAEASEHAVFASAELGQHRAGLGFVARFAEDEAVAFGDGVGGENDRWLRRPWGTRDFGRRICGQLF